jgi:iron(III) transport system ATP-binding protein
VFRSRCTGCGRCSACSPCSTGIVDLDVPAGTTLALLGPSGCGKSTLLKPLADLLKPDAERVVFGHETVADAVRCVPPERRALGMVFQDYALWPHMTVAGRRSS